MDFSNPSAPKELPEQITLHRLLSSLRLCRKFEFGCEVIRARMDKLSPPAVLEAARLLADTDLQRRSAARTQSAEELGDVALLTAELRDHLKGFRLPPSMSVTISKSHVLLTSSSL